MPSTYYVSASGSDSNNGLTRGSAWLTCSKVNATTLVPGDVVLFEGGRIFAGPLQPGQSGTSSQPITFGSYGNGRATIRVTGTSADGILFWDLSGFLVQDLNIVGPGSTVATKQGINLYNDTAARMTQAVTIRRCDVSGWKSGIIAGGDTKGWTNVLVEDCASHDNQVGGITTYGPVFSGSAPYANSNVTVRRCSATNNTGKAGTGTVTGTGIVLGNVDVGLIELSNASGNGDLCDFTAGPSGIAAYNCNAVVIRKCISYNNKTALADGNGFNLDYNTLNSRMEYCLSYNNEGPGFLYACPGAAEPTPLGSQGNTFRFNISWGNCANGSDLGEVYLFGSQLGSCNFYNNVFIAKDVGSAHPSCLAAGTHGAVTPTGVTFRNNVFKQLGSGPLLQSNSAFATSAILFQGNAYDKAGAVDIRWTSTYTSLATWRAAVSGQEQVSGTNVGLSGAVNLVNASLAPTVTDPTRSRAVPWLRPAAGSPLLAASLDLQSVFSIDPGTSDYDGLFPYAPYAVGATTLASSRSVLLEIDPASEDAANGPLVLTDTTYSLREFDIAPADYEAIYSSSADTEGDPYVGGRKRNRTISAKILVRGQGADTLQSAVYAIQQKVEKLCRERGTLKITTQAATEVVADVNYARMSPEVIPEMYVLNNALDVTIEFECRPLLRGTPRLLSDHAETTSPVLRFTESALEGDAYGLGTMVIDDDQGADQWWMVWGQRSRFYDGGSTAALFYEAEALTPQGGGSAVALSGASGGTAVRKLNLAQAYQSILSTQMASGGPYLSHVGTYRVFSRMQCGSSHTGDISAYFAWSEGDFRRFTANDPVIFEAEPFITGTNWGGRQRIVDLGQVTLNEAPQGTQRWEGRVVAKSTSATLGDALYVDWLMFVPVDEGSGEVNMTPLLQTPTVFTGRDEFDQTAGDLNGKVAPLGGTWSANTAFDVVTSGGGHVEITGNTGVNLATLGTATYTDLLHEVDWKLQTGGSLLRVAGIAARIVDANNYLFAGFLESASILVVEVTIAGNATFLKSIPMSITYDQWYRISLQVDANGHCAVWSRPQGFSPGSPVLTFWSSELATGGALASGKAGIIDTGGTSSLLRYYDNFVAASIVRDAAVFASQSAEVRWDRFHREDSGGTFWQKPTSAYEGDYLLIPPAGRENRSTEFIVKMSRNQQGEMPDPNIDDLSVRLQYTPRYLVLPSS